MKVYFHFYIFFLVVGLLSFEATSAYEPAVQWEKAFGGSDLDIGYSVQQTADGGYIIAGTTGYFYDHTEDVYLLKTDLSGNLLWQKTLGGKLNDRGYSVQQATDGGFIIAGYTASFGTEANDIYFIKTDPNGNLLWQKTFGRGFNDYGYSVRQTSDGG